MGLIPEDANIRILILFFSIVILYLMWGSISLWMQENQNVVIGAACLIIGGLLVWWWLQKPQQIRILDPKVAFTMLLLNTKWGRDFRNMHHVGLRDGVQPLVNIAKCEAMIRPDGMGVVHGKLLYPRPSYFAVLLNLTKHKVTDSDTNLVGYKIRFLDVKNETKELERIAPDIADTKAYQVGKKVEEKVKEKFEEEGII